MANGKPGRPLLDEGRPLTVRTYAYLDEQTLKELSDLEAQLGIRGTSALVRHACRELIRQHEEASASAA